MPIELLTLILNGYLLITLLLTVLYAVSLKIKNAGIVDVFWPLGFGILGIFYFFNTSGIIERKAILLILILAICIRLFWHILKRFLKEFPKEDPRYTQFKTEWGKNAIWMMLLAYYLQGTLMVIVSSVYPFIMMNTESKLSWIEITGLIVILVAFYGQTIADAQLRHFKSNPENKGKTCQIGLWYFSRHPNYFFEWLIWMGYFTVALSQLPMGFIFIFSPLLMLHFLINVTGVAATEAHALTSRGDYADYQKTTSALIPWFKRQTVAN